MVFLFILVLIASWVVVRIGAIAFQLTGLDWSLAKFQSLSCFSGTGFTTKESELIVSDRRRRKIASVLMVLGNAGLVTMIATTASALNPKQALIESFFHSYLPFDIPVELVVVVNLATLIIAIVAVYKILTNRKITAKLTK